MLGSFKTPVKLERKGLSLSAAIEDGAIVYRRRLDGKSVEKKIFAKSGKHLIIHPVEPTQTPEPISNHLLIDLECPIVMPPRSSRVLYLTFPVEIGVFIKSQNKNQLVDVFALSRNKFTLYGNEDAAVSLICKYWPSAVYLSIPSVLPLTAGVMKLTISNNAACWNEVTQVVFNSYHMALFYNEAMIFMKAYMKITDKGLAQTGFEKTIKREGMKRSLELYSLSKLNIASNVFVMELGL